MKELSNLKPLFTALSKARISTNQAALLVELYESKDGTISQEKAHAVMGCPKSAVGTHLFRLETTQAITKKLLEGDSVRKQITITPTGRKIIEDIAEMSSRLRTK